jgi:tagaturonate epimerase
MPDISDRLKIPILKPVLAQQSIRELSRTNRTADEVMDAAVWAVFQEGYKDGFGADADHLKDY